MKKIFSIILTVVLAITIFEAISHNNYSYANKTNIDLLQEKGNGKDILETAESDVRFTTLVAAIKAAGLEETLKGKGPFTVFAPTNDAFAKIPAAKIDELLKNSDKTDLENILYYHITPGNITAKDINRLNNKQIKMLNGSKTLVTIKDDKVFINGAKVIITDIKTKNGVIHVIDAVLIPKEITSLNN